MSFTLIRSRSESRSRLRSSSRKPFFRRGRSLDSNLSVRRCEVLSCNSADNVKEPERTIRRYKYVELDEKEPQEPDHCEDYSEDDYQIQVSSNRGRWVKEASLSLVPPKRRRDFEALLLAYVYPNYQSHYKLTAPFPVLQESCAVPYKGLHANRKFASLIYK
ncbi:MAG: hypothetical protein MMC33_004708 [Icmadophila ericetorum]|nr:hypothetical protein [Icmadophila ericetorum]